MCGITGFWNIRSPLSADAAKNIVLKMMDSINHRGPDEAGFYYDLDTGIALGHRRLNIIDLTPTGAQPMKTRSGKFLIVYNGELYNADILRAELQQRGIIFKGRSDTEVLIEYIEVFGIERALKAANGMFAFAAYDLIEKVLYLARDHAGIKPLFWSFQNGLFVFGSELKALLAHPDISYGIDPIALNNYFLFNYVPGDISIFSGVKKLLPGHYLKFSPQKDPVVISYWSEPTPGDYKYKDHRDFIAYFDNILNDAVCRQMASDVPLGVFLSGGIDSSLIALYAQKNSPRPVKTFSIAFEENKFDESKYARKVAEYLRTDHSEETLSMQSAQEFVPLIAQHYDEPFADSSQLPAFLLSRFARRHVTVALGGDGGDELFLGYRRYFQAYTLFPILNLVGSLPFTEWILRSISNTAWGNNSLFDNFSLKLEKMANMIAVPDNFRRYAELLSLWPGLHGPVLSNEARDSVRFILPSNNDNIYEQCRRHDFFNYLPGDILQKMDRASMAYGLEARVPFLDTEVVRSALSVPASIHAQGRHGKFILRQILNKHFPNGFFDRPKHGFSVPIADWLRHDLKDMAESYLSKESLERSGLLDSERIRKRWKEHSARTHNFSQSLWSVLVFQMWFDRYNR